MHRRQRLLCVGFGMGALVKKVPANSAHTMVMEGSLCSDVTLILLPY